MKLTLTLACLLLASAAHAQVVTNPASAEFPQADTEFAITASYHVDFYQCASVSGAGVCTGRAAQPFQSGLDVARGLVTGTAVKRVIDLHSAAAAGVLASFPIGIGFVAAIKVVGDTSVPGVAGTSAASPDSNPFFAQGRVPAALTAVVIR